MTRIFLKLSAVIVYGRHDLPSDERAFSLSSFEKLSFSMRLNKGFGLFSFSGDCLLDLNN